MKTTALKSRINSMHLYGKSAFSFLSVLLVTSFFFLATAQPSERPNVIFILADDMGYGDLACTGHPYVKSPNIDRLAEEGILFTQAYMAASWCAPTRYSLMSGKFPGREFYKTYNLLPDQPSVTAMLNDAGYATAHFGKWHMSQGDSISRSPGDFGIDKHFTTLSGGPGWTREDRQDEYLRAKTSGKYVDMAMDFIDKHKQDPFYINLWVQPTHSYINPTPEQLSVYEGLEVDVYDFESPHQQQFLNYVGRYGDLNKAMQAYCADVTALDKAIGRLMDYLKENRLEDNTLVVFTSDNGPGPLAGQIRDGSVVERYRKRPTLLNSVGSSGIYKERKLSLHDGGIHVPFIVKWPGQTPRGRVNDETVICSVDWLQTMAAVCGVELPGGQYDGINLASAFRGERIIREKQVYWLRNNGNAAVLNGNWKGMMINNEFSLYNVEQDPGEYYNVSGQYPEKASEIRKELETWLQSVPEPQ